MKNHSLYQFIFKEINKNSINKMNLANFTRLIRKKVQDVPSSQLLYVYKQLQRLKSNNNQFHLSDNDQFFTEKSKFNENKPMMKLESY